MPSEIVLCQRLKTTAAQLREWLEAHQTEPIAEFLRVRFEERYFDPFTSMDASKKNGFSTMAVCCLTLEALESFRRGWPSTERHTKAAFRNFLTREARFTAFNSLAVSFYENVRCGILHQGETTGGWKIRRSGPLFDEISLTVNATRFHQELHGVLLDYLGELKSSPYSSPLWKNARKKLASVLRNCELEGTSHDQ